MNDFIQVGLVSDSFRVRINLLVQTHSALDKAEIGEFRPDHYRDYKLANEKAGYEAEWGNQPPENYHWHHNENLSTMQLVPKDIHRLFPHQGGVSLTKNGGH